MNCKPGDLAVTVGCRSHPELNGILLTVVEAVATNIWLCSGHEIERVCEIYGGKPWIYDEKLRPIRDNDGEDETLAWAGKPQEVKA
jgi:hypothetical protein